MPEPQDHKHAPDIPIELHNWLTLIHKLRSQGLTFKEKDPDAPA